MLSAAAVLGAAIDPAAVAAVTQRDPAAVLTALDEAAAADLVTSGGWCFSHDLVRDTAATRRPPARRTGRCFPTPTCSSAAARD